MADLQPPRGRLLLLADAAQYLGLKVKHLRHLRFTRRVPFVKVGARVCFCQRDLDDWIEQHRKPAIDERSIKLELPSAPAPMPGDIRDLMPRKLRLSKKAS